MNDEEPYLFDLIGYVVVENVLDAGELAELNALIDRRDPWGRCERVGEGAMRTPLCRCRGGRLRCLQLCR